MIIRPLALTRVLNKTFRKEHVAREIFDIFVSELNTLLSKVDENESEEHLKYPLRDFFKKTSFADFEINTKYRTDLAIYTGETNKTPVGVIFEIKKPDNPEMISAESPNRKALHEAVLYYFREREEEQNDEVKHIIITNIYEWYVFDSHHFERQFYTPSLREEYKKWKSGQKTSKNTEHFYHIVSQFFDNSENEIECAYFDLRTYLKLLNENENALVPLQKILSATHLLKLNYATDSNTLNSMFYNELLYVMGLEEVKEGTKKLIKRCSLRDRNAGSILENTIATIRSENRMLKVDEMDEMGETEEEQIFAIALELNIRWLNRILFLKLLEAQLVRFRRNENAYRFLDIQIIGNFSELNELFFDVLAKKPEEREAFIKKELMHIPYLNSSLFEISELEDKLIRINNLKDRLTMPVYAQTVLTDRNKNRLKAELPTLQYLFSFLNAYNFSNEGADEIQDENKSLINASVLGLIFEKINGYKEGSFFTPGYITMYMSREAIQRAVIQKFTESGYATNEPLENVHQLKEKIEDRKEQTAW